MKSRVSELVEMSTDELYEEMVWVDWKSEEREVIEAFSEQLRPEDGLSYNDADSPTEITYRGQTYNNPLTSTPSDRYVTIFSIAEIVKPDYHIYTETDSCDGDTHGFLVLSDAQLEELRSIYAKWFKKRLRPLVLGIDGFSGYNVPYHGNESNGDPKLAEKFEEFNAKLMKRHERLMERVYGTRPFWKFW